MGRVKNMIIGLISLAILMVSVRDRLASTMGPKMIPRQTGARGIANFRIPYPRKPMSIMSQASETLLLMAYEPTTARTRMTGAKTPLGVLT
ncbi:unnamed protein product, partial [marine sediment metagenome]